MKNITKRFIISKKTFLYWNCQTHWDHLSVTAYTLFLVYAHAAAKLLMLKVLEYICTSLAVWFANFIIIANYFLQRFNMRGESFV